MSSTDINLIKTKTVGPFPLLALEERLRRVSWVVLLCLLVVGLIIGGSYVWVRQRYRSLEEEKVNLVRQINAGAIKEGILFSIKDRVELLTKVLAVVRPWGKLFPMLERIAPLPALSTVGVDEQGRVSLFLELASIDEAVSAVRSATQLVEEKLLRSPQLTSLSLGENGTVQVGLSFIPTF